MRKIIFFIPLIIGTVLAVLGAVWWNVNIKAPSGNAEKVKFTILKGSSAEKIGQGLANAGLIKSPFAFKLYAQLNNYTKNIPPGEFMIPKNLSLEDLIKYLIKGPEEYWVTIPEGLRREEIPEKFIEAFKLEGNDATKFRSEFLSESKYIEGHLFPDSYLFPPDVSAATVVARLRQTFDSKIPADFNTKLSNSGLSMEQAVTLASIIERETITDEERPIVAGILLNRIKDEMPLQADATVQYAVANKRCKANADCKWWEPPTRDDLEISSPFNTYLNLGLPPSPIANPGLSSLLAAVSPQATDYYYYIHDNDGHIHYAKTLQEHNANVAKYLR